MNPIRRLLHVMWTLAMVITRQDTEADTAAMMSPTTQLFPMDLHNSTSTSRRLSDGLECDLDLYDEFIASDEGQNIFIAATLCESRIVYLKNARAGYYGPVSQSDLRSAMCSDECLQSDSLHQLAMTTSRCTCAQLSAPTFVTYDFCRENSARMLCIHLGECGHWNCSLDDFMCLRYEWDRYYACTGARIALNSAFMAICFLLHLVLT